MAKPAKVNKKQAQASSPKKEEKKSSAKSIAKGKDKEAASKPKGKPEEKGIKSRLAKAQAAKTGKGAKGAISRERKAGKFLREVKLELTKVTWPGREELIQSTIVVLVAVVIAGVYIAIFDEIFSQLISLIS